MIKKQKITCFFENEGTCENDDSCFVGEECPFESTHKLGCDNYVKGEKE